MADGDWSQIDPSLPRLSLFDRLILDPDSDVTDRPDRQLAYVRDAVRRDLEALLNTRQRCIGWPAAESELDHSLLAYGMPDIYSVPLATESQRRLFCDTLEKVLKRFEPRFKSVSVELRTNTDPTDRTIRFRIRAVLWLDPDEAPIIYDSQLDSAARGFTVTPPQLG